MTDTLFADVSEFQVAVDDRYPYPVLSIRVSDGTYRDHKFAQNYAWMKRALDDGRLKLGIVYTYVRPNWADNYNTVIDMFNQNGGLHPKVAIMLDVEQGGNPAGDGSDWINKLYWSLARWCGDARRLFGYANSADYFGLWRTRPSGLRVIGAGYPTDPHLPGQIAHQYTNGVVMAGGLPLGAPPFGNCDMNAANGLSAEEMAAALGIESTKDEDEMAGWTPELVFRAMVLLENQAGVRRPSTARFRHLGEGDVNTCGGFAWTADGNVYDDLIIKLAEYGDPDAIRVLQEVANADLQRYPDRHSDAALAKRVLDKLPK